MIKEDEVKMTGEFLGLYETVGHLFSSEEVLFLLRLLQEKVKNPTFAL